MLRSTRLLYHVGILSFLSFCTFGCSSNKGERPSPLRADSTEISGANLKITYSSPAVKGRKIWGGLEPYHKVWRLGANKATVFETSKDVSIGGHEIPKGKYAVFAIPDTSSWTIIFNHHWDQWGSYNYDSEQDLFRMKITPEETDSLFERLSLQFVNESLRFRWEHVGFDLPITLHASNQ